MRVLLLAFTALVTSATAASACDLKNMMFGSNTANIIDKYKIDTLEVQKDGEFVLADSAAAICPEMPENALVEFMFVDDVLVRVNITNHGKNEALLEYAKSVLGESDDKKRKKDKNNKTNMALWASDKSRSVIYSANDVNGEREEILNVTSMLHKPLFDKVSEQHSKAADAYLKEKGRGEYAPSSASPDVSDKVETGPEDDGGLKDLIKKYKSNTKD